MTKSTTFTKAHGAAQLAYAAVGAVLIAVCSWISIPATVPFTLQTFAVFFVLSLLGGKLGTLSILVYILLGAAGIPGICRLLRRTWGSPGKHRGATSQVFLSWGCFTGH